MDAVVEESVEGGLRMKDETYWRDLTSQSALHFRPHLLALIAFLASAPLYPPNSTLMLRFAPNVSPAGEFLLAMLLSCLVSASCILLSSTQSLQWSHFETRKGRAGVTICALLYVTTLISLWVLLACGYGDTFTFVMIGIIAGLCMVPVIMRWVSLYLMDFRSVMFYGALACAGSSIVAWFVSLLPDLPVVLLESILIIAGAILPVVTKTRIPASARSSDASTFDNTELPEHANAATFTGIASSLRTFLSIVWVPLLGFLVCSFMMAAYSFDGDAGTARSEYVGGIVASIIVVTLCTLRLKSPFVMLMDRLVIPLCVAVSIVLGSFPAGTPLFFAGAMLIYVPLTLLSLFALSSLVAVAAAGELPFPFVFSAGFLLSCLASLLGMTVQVNVPPNVELGPILWIVLSVYFGVVVAHLGFVSWKQTCSLEDSDSPNNMRIPSESETAKLHALHNERILALTKECSLTKRENEILSYLSLGYGSVYIAKTLFISDNTARTHIRNIYRKLSVSSREELLSLVNDLK